MPWPNPAEVATLQVNGMLYKDWETVQVKHALIENPYFTFRFTCSEGQPIASNWASLQIRPGDECTITLGGEPAFQGLVHTRQVFYDGRRHYVEIQGASQMLSLAYSNVVHNTGEHNNVTYKQYAQELLKPFGITLIEEGGSIPSTKFPRLSNAPGTKVIEALEIPLRALGNFHFTSNLQDNLCVICGPTGGSDTVVEGQNILEGREIIYLPGVVEGTYGIGQMPGGDQAWGSKVSHVPFDMGQAAAIQKYSPLVTPLEIPAWNNQLLKGRNSADIAWQNMDWITVIITVQGWMKPSGGLWYRGQQVGVMSPMLLMKGGEGLTAKTVTFTQDNQRGTRTVLELCNDKAMGQFAPGGPS